MKRFSFIAALLLCFVTAASAAIRPAQPGIGGGGSSGSLTGTYTFLTPLVLSGSEVQLPAEISNLKTNRAITNASTKDFGVQVDTLYSKNLSLNSRWVYYDDFNENMVTPGLLPDAPTGHKYTLLTQYGNTNHIVQTNGYWSMGNTGAVYRSVHFRTNAQYGPMVYPNSFGGNFRYRKSTNNTIDGVERNLTFILSTNADFVAKPPFLHVSVGASGFHVGRELSATNLLYIHPLPGARNLQHLTNYNFSLTIISNILIAEIAGYKFMTYDESLTTTYAGLNVATWESTGTHTNEAWGEWDSAWAGYSAIGDDMLLGRAFGWETNFGLNKITFTGAGETRYQVKHEADLFQIYDSIAGDVLFSVDDATQETTIGASSAGGVTMPRLVTFPSNNVSGNINAGSVTLASSSAYDGTSWNGDLSVPTKDALRDKIETLGSGGGGGTNFPNVNLLLGGTNLTLSAGVRKAYHNQTNGSHGINLNLAVPESGYEVVYSLSNSGSSDITVTFYTNSVAANPYDIASKTNVNTFTAAASAITKVKLTYAANGLWLLDRVDGPASILKFGSGITAVTNGVNNLDVTISASGSSISAPTAMAYGVPYVFDGTLSGWEGMGGFWAVNEEFLGDAAAGQHGMNYFAESESGGGININGGGEIGAPGVLQLVTTNATDRAGVYMGSGSLNSIRLSNVVVCVVARVQAGQTGGDAETMRIGLVNSITADGSAGFYLRKTNDVWSGLTSQSSTHTSGSGSNVVALEWTWLGAVFDGTNAIFYQGSTDKTMTAFATNSANIPNASQMSPAINVIRYAGTTARQTNKVDVFRVGVRRL